MSKDTKTFAETETLPFTNAFYFIFLFSSVVFDYKTQVS